MKMAKVMMMIDDGKADDDDDDGDGDDNGKDVDGHGDERLYQAVEAGGSWSKSKGDWENLKKKNYDDDCLDERNLYACTHQKLHVDMVGALAPKQLGLRDAAAVIYQPTNRARDIEAWW